MDTESRERERTTARQTNYCNAALVVGRLTYSVDWRKDTGGQMKDKQKERKRRK